MIKEPGCNCCLGRVLAAPGSEALSNIAWITDLAKAPNNGFSNIAIRIMSTMHNSRSVQLDAINHSIGHRLDQRLPSTGIQTDVWKFNESITSGLYEVK